MGVSAKLFLHLFRKIKRFSQCPSVRKTSVHLYMRRIKYSSMRIFLFGRCIPGIDTESISNPIVRKLTKSTEILYDFAISKDSIDRIDSVFLYLSHRGYLSSVNTSAKPRNIELRP